MVTTSSNLSHCMTVALHCVAEITLVFRRKNTKETLENGVRKISAGHSKRNVVSTKTRVHNELGSGKRSQVLVPLGCSCRPHRKSGRCQRGRKMEAAEGQSQRARVAPWLGGGQLLSWLPLSFLTSEHTYGRRHGSGFTGKLQVRFVPGKAVPRGVQGAAAWEGCARGTGIVILPCVTVRRQPAGQTGRPGVTVKDSIGGGLGGIHLSSPAVTPLFPSTVVSADCNECPRPLCSLGERNVRVLSSESQCCCSQEYVISSISLFGFYLWSSVSVCSEHSGGEARESSHPYGSSCKCNVTMGTVGARTCVIRIQGSDRLVGMLRWGVAARGQEEQRGDQPTASQSVSETGLLCCEPGN